MIAPILRYQSQETKLIDTNWNDVPPYILYGERRNRNILIVFSKDQLNIIILKFHIVVQRSLFCMPMTNQVRKAQSRQSIMNRRYAW